MMRREQGMTALEIMVGVVLVIIVGALFFWIFWKTGAKGRDIQREQDIKQMQNALNLYITSVGRFPACGSEIVVNGIDDCLTVELKRMGVLAGVPADPLHGRGGQCNESNSHVYCYESLNGLNYALKYNLETGNVAGHASGWRSVSQ